MAPMVAPELLCLAMFVCAVGLLMAGYPVAFTLAGVALLFSLLGAAFGAFDLSLLAAFPQRIFATMSNPILVAVPLFVLMGVVLERSRIASNLLDTMGRLFGRRPGGLAISVTLVGAVLAASTGIVGATVVTMGLISLPAMLRCGYSPAFACGSIAASGTLGQIIPPSVILVLLGDQLAAAYQSAQSQRGNFAPDSVTITDLFAGAVIPGLSLVLLYLLYQIGFAWLRPGSAPPLAERVRAAGDPGLARELLRSLAAPILLVVAVLGSILSGVAEPGEAAGTGAVGAFLLTGLRLAPERPWPIYGAAIALAALLALAALVDLRPQRENVGAQGWAAIALAAGLSAAAVWGLAIALLRCWRAREADGERVLNAVTRSTTRLVAMVFSILIGAAMFSLVFRGLNGDVWIEEHLTSLPGGALGAVMVVMLVMFLMGFFLDFLEIIFIVVPIVAPILLKMEIAPGETISPVWLGVLIAVNLQTSFLTPPFGFSLFFLRGVAPPEVRTIDIYRGVVPFILLQIVCLVLMWFAPGMATWLPRALYAG